MNRVMQAYDEKVKVDQQNAMSREAKLELNKGLKEFEQAKIN